MTPSSPPIASTNAPIAALTTLSHWRVNEQLWSSALPEPAHWAAIAGAGARTVIDLRGPDEGAPADEQAAVEAAGMHYLSLPTAGEGAITRAQATVLSQRLASSEGPVWLHCTSGNRAGALIALIAAEEGADLDAALARGRAAGLTRLEAVVRAQLTATSP